MNVRIFNVDHDDCDDPWIALVSPLLYFTDVGYSLKKGTQLTKPSV